MRPILMKGHERSITFLKMNRDGDLLFSCGKDSELSVWRSSDGVRIGSYKGHSGSIWCVDITHDSKYIFTASADSTVKVWETMSGICIKTIDVGTPCRFLELDEGNKRLAVVKDAFAEQCAQIYLYDVPSDITQMSDVPTMMTANNEKSLRLSAMSWGFLNKYIIAAGSDGKLYEYDPTDLSLIQKITVHEERINSLCFNNEKTILLTASSDNTTKLIDGETFEVIKTYTSDRNVNACAFSPNMEIIALGGGLEARDVTVTAASVGNFEVHFFNMINESEIGKVKGHFGPVNALVFNPDGRSFISGAEDGYIRLHFFDDDYYQLISKHIEEVQGIINSNEN